MHAVIVGGGASGVAIQHACEAEGIQARQVSRSTGFDVTADSLPQLEADVVIEATNIVATGRKPCIEFFERSAPTDRRSRDTDTSRAKRPRKRRPGGSALP